MKINFAWNLAGNAVYAASQLAFLVGLAHLSGREDVGRFALAIAITTPVILLANLQLITIQATDARDEFRFRDYLKLRLITTPIAFALIVAIAWLGGYERRTAWVIVALGVAKAIEAISDVCYGNLQRHEQMRPVGVSLMLKGPPVFASVMLGVHLAGSLVVGVLCTAAVQLLVLVAYDIPRNRRLWGPRGGTPPTAGPGLNTTLAVARRALPLAMAVCLNMVVIYMPIYFVEHWQGEAQLGVFAAQLHLILAGTLIIKAMGQAANPRLAHHFVQGALNAFRSLLFKLITVAVVMSAGAVLLAWLVGAEILALVYGSEYAGHTALFVVLALGGGLGFTGATIIYGIMAARAISTHLLLYLIVAVLATVVCGVAVPKWGLVGAAWATVLINGVALVLVALGMARTLRRRGNG